MRGLIIVGVVLASISVADVATAQLGGWDTLLLGSGDSEASFEAVEREQEEFMAGFVAAQDGLMEAQSIVAEAFNLKGEKDKLDAERRAFSQGNVEKKRLKKSMGLTKSANKAIQAKLKAGDELSDEGKKLIAASLVPYAKSVASVAGMVKDAEQLSRAIQGHIASGGVLGALKLKKTFSIALFVLPKVPGMAKDMTIQLTRMVKYARKNGVDVPKEASDLI